MVKLNFCRITLGNFTELFFLFSNCGIVNPRLAYTGIVWMLRDFLIIILLSLMERNENIVAAGYRVKALEIRGGMLVSGLLEK